MHITRPIDMTNLHSLPFFAGLSQEECEEKIRHLVVEKYLQVVRDVHERVMAAKTDPSVLRKGFWNPIDYCKVATELGYDITELKKNGAFCHGLPPAGFEHLSSEDTNIDEDIAEFPNSPLSNKKVAAYQIKDDYSPSAALKSVWNSLSFIDCQEAIQIACYEVLLEIFREDTFNQFFAGKLILCPAIDFTPIEFFLECTIVTSFKEMLEGDQGYMKNSRLYPFRHLIGTDQGHHFVCIQQGPDTRVATFGKSPEGCSEEEMYKLEVDTFNHEPIPFTSVLSSELVEKYEGYIGAIRTDKAYTNAEPVTLEGIKEEPHNAGLEPGGWRFSLFKIQLALKMLQSTSDSKIVD